MSYESPFPERFEPEYLVVSDVVADFHRKYGDPLQKPRFIGMSDYLHLQRYPATFHLGNPKLQPTASTLILPSDSEHSGTADQQHQRNEVSAESSTGKVVGGAAAGALIGAIFGPVGIFLGGWLGAIVAGE